MRTKLFMAVLGSGCLVLGAGSGFTVQGSGAPESALRTQSQQLRTQNPNPSTQNPAPGTGSNISPARDLVTTYCVSCHNPKLKTGGLVIDPAQAERVGQSPETWEKV